MKWADAEVMPDIDIGWPSAVTTLSNVTSLDTDQLDQDLKTVLVEKAVGTVHTKVVNGMHKGGGIYMYTDVYKWLTETSGLGLAEQARKLMDPHR